ncbi:class I SAM-dependent methyltransferase [Pontibacter sp. BT310]|uniref:Class I SAM-dependent methyltransferase n=1 Tax=Pontibacter populi TaxID=890055 RepID=A0ABS6XEV7_9BACT|nr:MULTISPECIES: class I SAM-dependent methyltransferase [Pontibacter]MBJ6118807.1 class I SAM-dependent methyltransferase [Pontibacter sp. BT310]MBR0571235.1 class I SAM-dependent methyltransferase [Microvirga sp. STS03]MBW3365661.1 class I SAM-dependent methyltransferase [Pontibacter populi]
MPDNYLEVNRELWNTRTLTHIHSEFYDVATFKAGRNSLNDIELALLGNVSGKKILHLQCHFGQDTLSLARMGAIVTGVDLSEVAIEKARGLATELNLNARFICCNVLELDKYLEEQFDIVFCSYGVIGWHPDMNAFATIVNKFLKPGGTFYLVEFHPFIWMYDNNQEHILYSYFNDGPIVEVEEGTYADKDAPIKNNSYTWNHPLSDVIGSLLKNGLTLTNFQEYDYSPYNIFKDMTQDGNKYRLKEGKSPLVYAVEVVKK